MYKKQTVFTILCSVLLTGEPKSGGVRDSWPDGILGIKIISQDYKETINWNFYAYLFKYRTSSECLVVPTQSILVKDSYTGNTWEYTVQRQNFVTFFVYSYSTELQHSLLLMGTRRNCLKKI